MFFTGQRGKLISPCYPWVVNVVNGNKELRCRWRCRHHLHMERHQLWEAVRDPGRRSSRAGPLAFIPRSNPIIRLPSRPTFTHQSDIRWLSGINCNPLRFSGHEHRLPICTSIYIEQRLLFKCGYIYDICSVSTLTGWGTRIVPQKWHYDLSQSWHPFKF